MHSQQNNGLEGAHGARIEGEYHALLDAAVDAIIVIDGAGIIQLVNHSATRLFGYQEQELIGSNVSILMPAAHAREHDNYLRRYLATGEAHIIGIGREVQARRRDGTLFAADLAVGRVSGVGEPRFVGFIRDISDRRRMEEDARRARKRLAQASRKAVLGEMAAGFAHEINQPLAAIATYAQAGQRMLGSGASATDTAEVLAQIAQQALRAGEVIRRLRALLADRGAEREPVAVNTLLLETRELAEADALEQGADIQVAPVAADLKVAIDTAQIQQLLLILLTNAMEAVRTGDYPRRIEMSAVEAAGSVLVRVADRGPGIAPSRVARLFEPFQTTRPGGTGLSLAAAQSIARAHGGRLWYEPNPGGGASFQIELPALQDSR